MPLSYLNPGAYLAMDIARECVPESHGLFYAALLNLSGREAEDYKEEFQDADPDGEALTVDDLGRHILIAGSTDPGGYLFRAVFRYDENQHMLVSEVTHADGRPIYRADFARTSASPSS